MKVIILAGGKGIRISEESAIKPKPLIEIGSKPILWHIMKLYSSFGINDFIICCGYKGYLLKEYFVNYYLHNADIDIDLKNSKVKIKKNKNEHWNVKLIDTGENTMTGGRILRVKKFIKKGEDFCLTYGDGLSDINIKKLILFHKKYKNLATITAAKPTGRYGSIQIGNKNIVSNFIEKPEGDNNWINGGFFVLNEGIFKYLKNDQDIWEQGPLQKLSEEKKLLAYKHYGFWKAMYTLSDKQYLENIWRSKKIPWKLWND
jgi:glucose-1-phosphate cytidylyltransferase